MIPIGIQIHESNINLFNLFAMLTLNRHCYAGRACALEASGAVGLTKPRCPVTAVEAGQCHSVHMYNCNSVDHELFEFGDHEVYQ